MKDTPLDISEIYRTLKEHYFFIAVSIGIFILVAIIINSLVPPAYQAETIIRIKQSRGLENSLLADLPGGSTGRQYMSTYAEIIKSHTVVAAVVEEIESQKGKKPSLGSIATQPVKDTELMKISVQAQTPEEAELVADTLVQKFMEQNTYFARSEQTTVREFIAARLQEAKRDLEKSENALQRYQRKEKIIIPNTGTSAMLDRMSSINKLKADNTVALASAQAKLTNAQQNLVQDKVIAIADNALIRQYKTNLANLEMDLVGLLGKYTDKHPQVIATKAKVAETKLKLDDEITRVVNAQAPTGNPIHLALLQNKLQAEADIDAITAQNIAIDRVLTENENEFAKLPGKEQGLGRLMRDVAVAQEIYTMLAKRHEEARISEVMQPANVQVIEKAVAGSKPMKPNKVLNILIGAMLGLLSGITVLLLKENIHRSIRTADDVRYYLDLPVTGSIPSFDR